MHCCFWETKSRLKRRLINPVLNLANFERHYWHVSEGKGFEGHDWKMYDFDMTRIKSLFSDI